MFRWVEHAFELSQKYPNYKEQIEELHSEYQLLKDQVTQTKARILFLSESPSPSIDEILVTKAAYDDIVQSLQVHERHLFQTSIDSCIRSLVIMQQELDHLDREETQACVKLIGDIEKTFNETKIIIQNYQRFQEVEQLISELKTRVF